MKIWRILICFFASIVLLNTNIIHADTNIVGSMGNESSLSISASTGSIHFTGYASPNALVYFYENNQVVGTVLANSNSAFDKTLTGCYEGFHTVQVFATDTNSVNTIAVNYSVNVVIGQETSVSLILPPTIIIDSDKVKKPAPLISHGRGLNNSSIQIFINGTRDSRTISVSTDANGNWSANINPKLHLGQKIARAISLNGLGGQSELSAEKGYTVLRSADLNVDNIVDLTDFSILMYSYGKVNFPNQAADISDDNIVDLVDFSIMMSNWSR